MRDSRLIVISAARGGGPLFPPARGGAPDKIFAPPFWPRGPAARLAGHPPPRPGRGRQSSWRGNEAPGPYWLRVVCIRRILPLCRHDGDRHEPSYGRRAVCLVAMLLVEQRQVDRVAQLAVAAIARMQPVAAI